MRYIIHFFTLVLSLAHYGSPLAAANEEGWQSFLCPAVAWKEASNHNQYSQMINQFLASNLAEKMRYDPKQGSLGGKVKRYSMIIMQNSNNGILEVLKLYELVSGDYIASDGSEVPTHFFDWLAEAIGSRDLLSHKYVLHGNDMTILYFDGNWCKGAIYRGVADMSVSEAPAVVRLARIVKALVYKEIGH